MAAIAIQQIGAGGLANVTFAAANAGGDTVVPGIEDAGWNLNPVLLIVKNADTTGSDVTVAGLSAVTVPATTGTAVIPVNGGIQQASRAITYSKVTSLTVAAVQL